MLPASLHLALHLLTFLQTDAMFYQFVYLRISLDPININPRHVYRTLFIMALSKLADGSSACSYPTLPDTPNHPPSSFNFPPREFGKKQIVKRFCQLSWFSKWKWLHYDEDDDVVFCHLCVTALVEGH